MLSQEERTKRKVSYKSLNYTLQRFKERGKALFGDIPLPDMINEAVSHILNYQRSVIIPDERPNTQSTHSVIFLTNYGRLASIPVVIEEDKITILTLKDVVKDEVNPNWHIEQFNKIGNLKGLPIIPLVYKHNEKA